MLPLSQLGGFIMGARAAMLLGLPGAVAIASTIVDVTLEVLGQLGYTAIGLAILAHLRPETRLIGWTAAGLAVGVVAVAGFIVVQRRGSASPGARCSWRVAWRWSPGWWRACGRSRDELAAIYRRRGALCLAGLLHLASWIASSVEAWLALHLMGADLGIAAVHRDREPALRDPQRRLRGAQRGRRAGRRLHHAGRRLRPARRRWRSRSRC